MVKSIYSFIFIVAMTLISSTLDIYLTRNSILPGASALGLLVLTLCFLCGTLLKSKAHGINLGYSYFKIYSWFLLFFGWCTLSLFLHGINGNSLITISRYLVYSLVPLMALFCMSRMDNPRRVLEISLMVGIVLISGSILIDFFIPGSFRDHGARAAGLIPNPNGSAQSLLMTVLIFILISRTARLRYLVLFLAIACLVATLSRSAMIMFIFICLVAFNQDLEKPNISRKAFKGLVVVLALPLVLLTANFLLGYVSNATFEARFLKIFEQGEIFDADDARISLARDYLTLWLESPLTGYGVGFTDSDENPILGSTHNLYLKIMVETGLIGFIIFALFFISAFFKSVYSNGKYIIFTWAVVVILGIFTNTLLDNRFYYFVIFILSFNLRALGRPNEKIN